MKERPSKPACALRALGRLDLESLERTEPLPPEDPRFWTQTTRRLKRTPNPRPPRVEDHSRRLRWS